MDNRQNIDTFFREFLNNVESAQKEANIHVEVLLKNTTLENFRSESFFGEQWQPRKDRKNTRKLLVKSGILYRSVDILRSQPGLVVIGSQIPYAGIHNNGGTINRAARSETFVRNRYRKGPKSKMFGGMGAFRKGTSQGRGQTYRAYSVSMPRRRFIGPHPILLQKLRETLGEALTLRLR